MSLDWSIGKCADYTELTSDKEWPITNGIIWWCMGVDVGTLKSEATCEEWLARYLFACKVDGSEPQITLKDLVRRIGLHTNVSTTTHSQWTKKAMANAMRSIAREIDRQREEMSDETR